MASIFIMRATSAFKVINYACKNREKWRTGLIFDTTNRISATCGGLLGEKIPQVELIITVSLTMIRNYQRLRRWQPEHEAAPLGWAPGCSRTSSVTKVISASTETPPAAPWPRSTPLTYRNAWHTHGAA